LTQQTTAVSTRFGLGETSVRAETLAAPKKTSALKEKATVTMTLTAVETCGVGLITALAKALTIPTIVA